MNREKPNCYECKHRGCVPGDAHSCCNHPKIEKAPMGELAALFGSVGRLLNVIQEAKKLNIVGHPQGIRRGWFNWPYNFDPTWLKSCDGFENKKAATLKSK